MDEKVHLVPTMDSCSRVMALANSSQRPLAMPSRPPKLAMTAQYVRPVSMTLGQMAQSKQGGVR